MTATAPAQTSTPTTPTIGTGALRRVPVQGRSVARVQRMLDACAAIVDEIGYEGLTTTVLAERAGVAIGSVYQFFPDKRAVVQALADRNLAAYLQRLSARCADSALRGWWDGVDAGIDEYVHMHRTVPGFRTLHLAASGRSGPFDGEHDNNKVIAAHMAEALAARFAVVDTPQLRFALAIAVEAADALVRMAFRRDPAGDDRVMTEAKALIREYLHRHLR